MYGSVANKSSELHISSNFWIHGTKERTLHDRGSDVNDGFTILEILVAMSIFIVVIAAAVFSFVQFSEEQRRTRAVAGAQTDTLNVLETIAFDVRNGAIDYAFYRANATLDLTDPQQLLVLRNAENDQLRYQWNNATDTIGVCVCSQDTICTDPSDFNDPTICRPSDFDRIHSDNTEIIDVKFYVSPAWDSFFTPTGSSGCFTGGTFDEAVGLCRPGPLGCAPDQTNVGGYCSGPHLQPRVTMMMTGSQGEETSLVQTTISTRQYER
ncbi:MAG: type II secretion system protein [Candidatus Kerfeldbacteria bacterium]|nr:type II secretion system protein [Candidatus Kerfeldbacteria bacterium]